MMVWLTIVGGSAVAKNEVVWNPGELTLNNGIQYKGELSYNWYAEVVEFRADDRIRAFSASQVREFKYFDNQQRSIRKIVAVTYPVHPSLRRPVFMEEVMVGPLSVYRRLRHSHGLLKMSNPSLPPNESLDDFSYLVFQGDEVVNMDTFYRTIWPQMTAEYDEELKKYANLLPNDIQNTLVQLRLINRYNYLKMQSVWQVYSAASNLYVGL